MGTTRTPERLRWEAQRLLIEADKAQQLRPQYLKRATALAAKADLIERAALNKAAPTDESARSSSSRGDIALFRNWILFARDYLGASLQSMPACAGLKHFRSGLAEPESTFAIGKRRSFVCTQSSARPDRCGCIGSALLESLTSILTPSITGARPSSDLQCDQEEI
jgi:hypothetical protein